MDQLIKVWVVSLAVSLLICFGISELFFSEQNYFWYIALIYLIIIPLISFAIRIVHALLSYPLSHKVVIEAYYQGFIDRGFPVLSENIARQVDWEEYIVKLMDWPDATRQQVIGSSILFGVVEHIKTQNMITALLNRITIKKAYLKYMKNNRNSVEEHKAFAGYLIDPSVDLDDLDLS